MPNTFRASVERGNGKVGTDNIPAKTPPPKDGGEAMLALLLFLRRRLAEDDAEADAVPSDERRLAAAR